MTRVAQQRENSRCLWGLIAIVLVGFLFRAARINESLWYDEIASWQVYCADAHSPLAIMAKFDDPINHILSNVLLWCSVNAFEPWTGAEIAFRLPALLFSLLAIVAMYGLGREAGGTRVGLIAAGLMAVLPVAVLEGVEARGYSMMIFFSAAATWILVDLFRRERRRWRWIAYAIVCALGVWAQFVAAFVPIGHAVWLAWRAIRRGTWRDLRQGFAAQCLAGLISLALYAPMIPAMLKSRSMFIASHPDQPRIFGQEGLHALLQLGGSWYWWAAWPGLILAAIGCFAARGMIRGNSQRREEASQVVAASLIGLPLMIATVSLSGSWIYARFTLFALPGAILLIALGMDSLSSLKRPLAIAAMTIILIASIADLRVRPPKQPLREAMEYIRDHQAQGDNVLAIGLAHPVSLIYARDIHLSYTMRHGVELADRLNEIHPRWVVVEYPRSVKPETYQLLKDAGFDEAPHRLPGWADWNNGDILIYEQR